MPHINPGDPRAHLDRQEKDALADLTVEFVKAQVSRGMGDAPACLECTGRVLFIAGVRLLGEAIRRGTVGEVFGLAKAAQVTAQGLEEQAEIMPLVGLRRGLEGAANRAGMKADAE